VSTFWDKSLKISLYYIIILGTFLYIFLSENVKILIFLFDSAKKCSRSTSFPRRCNYYSPLSSSTLQESQPRLHNGRIEGIQGESAPAEFWDLAGHLSALFRTYMHVIPPNSVAVPISMECRYHH